MKKFIINALPFVAMGTSLTIIAVFYKKDKKTYLEEGWFLE